MVTIMTTAANAALPEEWALHAAASTTAAVETKSLQQCERVLDMMLTQRGDAFAEVERVLAADRRMCVRALSARRPHRACRQCRACDRCLLRALPRSRRHALTSAMSHIVTPLLRAHGSTATRLVRPRSTVRSSRTGRSTFSRLLSRTRSTSTSAGGV